jgi:hypothetical protein
MNIKTEECINQIACVDLLIYSFTCNITIVLISSQSSRTPLQLQVHGTRPQTN